jgi:hypothetical protein
MKQIAILRTELMAEVLVLVAVLLIAVVVTVAIWDRVSS